MIDNRQFVAHYGLGSTFGTQVWAMNARSWISYNISEMAMRSAKVEGAASLTWGVPSFRTPEPIRRTVAEELERDPEIGKYALPDGLPGLRKLVAV
jgi:aspartate/methionine/tyrosine aminotransferase